MTDLPRICPACGSQRHCVLPGCPLPQDVKPYYDDGTVTIYHGDCLGFLAAVDADVLVTDPPYGVDLGRDNDKRGAGPAQRHGLAKNSYATYVDTYENYCQVVVPAIGAAVASTTRGAVFTGPHFQELPKADAMGGIYCRTGGGRHRWGFKTFLPVLFYGVDPLLHKGARPNVLESNEQAEHNGHPCPKPITWMRWLVQRVALEGEVVLDPFAGSGTTLRAAKDLGFRAVGIEIDERYCEIAALRCAQDVLNLGEAA